MRHANKHDSIRVSYNVQSYIHIAEIEGKLGIKWSKILAEGTWWVKYDSIHIRLNDQTTSIPLHHGDEGERKWPERVEIVDEDGTTLEEMGY